MAAVLRVRPAAAAPRDAAAHDRPGPPLPSTGHRSTPRNSDSGNLKAEPELKLGAAALPHTRRNRTRRIGLYRCVGLCHCVRRRDRILTAIVVILVGIAAFACMRDLDRSPSTTAIADRRLLPGRWDAVSASASAGDATYVPRTRRTPPSPGQLSEWSPMHARCMLQLSL